MKVLKTLAAIVGAIIVVAVLYLLLADFSKYRPDIEAAVAEATGREFRINGELEIRPLFSPWVRMTDVTLANAAWAGEPNMVEVGEVAVKVGLWSLLSGPIVIKDFQLHDVDVLVLTTADGASNLDFDVPQEEVAVAAEEEAEPSAEPPVVVLNADVSNVTVTRKKPQSDDLVLALDSLTVITDDDDQHAIVGQGSFVNRALTLDGIVSEQQANFNATFGNIQVQSVTQHRGSEADMDITISRLTDVGEVLEITNLPAEDLTLSGNLALRGERLLLSDLTFGVATAKLIINGELDGANSAAQLELGIDAPSMAVLGNDLPDIPMTGSASVSVAGTTTTVEPFELRFGESDLSGNLTSVSGDEPSLTLQVRSSLIDMRPFREEEASEAEAESDSAAAEVEDTAAEDSPYVFSDDPLPLDMLRALQMNVDIAIDRFQGQTSHFSDVVILVNAENGLITLENSLEGGRGGQFDNKISMQAMENSANLTIDANAAELKMGAFSGEGIPDDLVPVTELDLDIEAAGASPRQLAASTNGRMLMTQGPGRITNKLIGKLSGDIVAQLFGALNPFSKDEEFSNWDCSIFAIDFVSGEGEISGFLLQGEKIMVVGGGKVDLNDEQLRIEFNTKPRAGVGVSADMFVTPFVLLSGSLANPGVGLNKKGALLEGGLAVATGGLSFLYKGLVDRATAEADQCEATLAELGESLP